MVDQNGDSTVNSENNDVEAKSKLHLLCIQSKQVILFVSCQNSLL